MMHGTHNVTLTHCNMMHGTHNVTLTHCNMMHGTHVTFTHCNMMHGTHNVTLTHCNIMHGTHNVKLYVLIQIHITLQNSTCLPHYKGMSLLLSHFHDVQILNLGKKISTARDPDFAMFDNTITRTRGMGVVYCRYAEAG